MMRLKKLLVLFVGLVTVQISVNAQSFESFKPLATELLRKIEDQKEHSIMYQYRSKLSQQEIVEFYRDMFSRQGFREDSVSAESEDSNTPFIFLNEQEGKAATLVFVPDPDEQGMMYLLGIAQAGEVKIKRDQIAEFLRNFAESVTEPKSVDFMPLYPGVKQLEYAEWRVSSSTSMGYLTHDSAEMVEKFYVGNMPSFGWALTKAEPHRGTYKNITEWFPLIAPNSNFCPQCAVLPDIPPLRIRGTKLTFEQEGKKCVVTVHTFEDMVAVSRGTIYNMDFIQQHGSTVIAVIYFSGEQSDVSRE